MLFPTLLFCISKCGCLFGVDDKPLFYWIQIGPSLKGHHLFCLIVGNNHFKDKMFYPNLYPNDCFFRFYIDTTVTSPSTTTWIVPINFAYPLSKWSDFDKTTPEDWMTKSRLNVDLKERPYIINVQQTG